eukprot:2918600-Amphidinium_carterae.1
MASNVSRNLCDTESEMPHFPETRISAEQSEPDYVRCVATGTQICFRKKRLKNTSKPEKWLSL